jgi:hypothetical protein
VDSDGGELKVDSDGGEIEGGNTAILSLPIAVPSPDLYLSLLLSGKPFL